ncbi:hypothetical protein KI387_034326, partial [Taxus chinensis]
RFLGLFSVVPLRKDGIPFWVAPSGYVGFTAISVRVIPVIFPSLKWYLVLISYIVAPSPCLFAIHMEQVVMGYSKIGCLELSIKQALDVTVLRFLLVSKNREDLLQLDKDIEHLYRDLILSLNTSNVVYRPVELPYPDHAIGIQHQVQKVTEYLECQSDKAAKAVIVYGLGGIGKTTITDAAFANLQKNLEAGYRTSMIKLNEDLHLNPKIEELQAQILHKLTGQKHEITHYKIGQDEIRKCLKKGPVLLYVDNVLRREYLEQILPKKLDSPQKFRLLLTARKRDVVETVDSCGIEQCKVYEIEPLSMDACTDILCSKIGISKDHKMHEINTVAEKCSGIPLVLEVVGGYIRRARRDNMEAQAIERVIHGLEKGEAFSGDAQDTGYESKLLFAYDDLIPAAKDAFLDICIFFYGWDWEEVACIVGEEELRTLAEGALVKRIAEKVNVHDVLVGIGRNKSKGIRITSTEELSSALLQNVDRIKGIRLAANRLPYSELSAEKLDQMHQSLRVLELGDWTIINGICNNKFHSLRFLQAGDVPHIPFNMALLSDLKYFANGSGKHICFNTPSQISSGLAVLKLHERSYCERFEDIPQILAGLSTLRSLELHGFAGLFELYEGFGNLSKLVHLDLSQCGLLQLPKALGQLKSMQTLNLSGCKELKELPESIGELERLEILRLEGCTKLKRLPSSFGVLKSLASLSLKHCQVLQELPESFGALSCLRHLDLSHCESINELPSTFHKLSSLRFLCLIWCDSLLYLPDNLGNLTSLIELEVFCRKLVRLPNSIGQLKSLSSYMLMYQCFQLKLLPEEFCDLNLEILELPDCVSLEKLPDRFKEFTRLKHLRLCTCRSLVRLPQGFGTLPALEELNLNSCIKLQELCSDFDCLSSLKKLHLSKCPELKGVCMDSVIKVRSLNYVDIRGSLQLKDRWTELQQDKDWEIFVNTEEDDEDGRLLKKAASMFFNDECVLFDCHGCQFKPSTLLPNTTLVLVFEWNISRDSWKQFMENIEELLKPSIYSHVIYIRKGFPVSDASIQVSMESKKGITLGFPCDYSRVSLAFETILSKVIGPSYIYGSPDYAIITTVFEKEGAKQFSKWENISSLFHERNFKSENYVRIKRLTEVAQKSNIELLKSLLVTQGKYFLLVNNSKQVSIESLEGKVVLLLISRLNIFPTEICALKEIYIKTCNKQQFEVVWMPIVDAYHDTWGPYVRAVEYMPWPAMRDPWSIEPAVLKFVREDLDFENSPLLVSVDKKGRFSCNHNFKQVVEMWGVEDTNDS